MEYRPGVYEGDIETRAPRERLKAIFHVKYGQNGYMSVDSACLQ